jgi:hypothetical protein
MGFRLGRIGPWQTSGTLLAQVGSGAGRAETMLTCGSALRGLSSRLDGESKLSEHLDGAGLPALEITGESTEASIEK